MSNIVYSCSIHNFCYFIIVCLFYFINDKQKKETNIDVTTYIRTSNANIR